MLKLAGKVLGFTCGVEPSYNSFCSGKVLVAVSKNSISGAYLGFFALGGMVPEKETNFYTSCTTYDPTKPLNSCNLKFETLKFGDPRHSMLHHALDSHFHLVSNWRKMFDWSTGTRRRSDCSLKGHAHATERFGIANYQASCWEESCCPFPCAYSAIFSTLSVQGN